MVLVHRYLSVTAAARACPSCATPLPEEALFCLHCGKATPTEPGVPPRTAATGVLEVDRVRKALAGRGYAVERILGEGGMATVYLATDLKHHRQVAVKVMRPDLAATLGADRFLREVEISAQLSHPNILPVHDSGDAGGVLYYVMPYVEGESLQDRIKRETQLPVDEALRIAREVSESLAYAHQRKIVHRDIKPGNIMLTAGHALVADFGIARAVGASGGATITQTGFAVGTPQYMSPEQASGSAAVDGRSDVYAVGCMLYEMLAGEAPFTGPTSQAIILRSMTEAPRPLTASRAGLLPAIEAVVTRAMAKNPADRWQTASDFARALGSAEDQIRLGVISGSQTPVPMPVVRAAPPRRTRLLAGGLAILVLAVVAASLLRRGAASGAESAALVRLAVLPFQNRGAAEDNYFVDGMADQVRGKLMALAGFQVTARSSSDQYRDSPKTPQEIGRELGVDYLLTSTVTWIKAPDGKSRIQVVPELVQVKTGAGTWQQSFDADLTDIFQVQGTIATQVAGALNVALGPKEKQELVERPTSNLAAYDLYLKALAVPGNDPASLRQSIAYFEQAVALDSAFAEAWARLGRTLSNLYFNSTPTPELAARALRAVDRAQALAPDAVLTHSARSLYLVNVKNDPEAARAEVMAAMRLAPNDAQVRRMAAGMESSQGRWPEALAHAQQAVKLDPRSRGAKANLFGYLVVMRKYPEALALGREILAEAPADLGAQENMAFIHLMQGDLAGARAVIRAVPAEVPRTTVASYFAVYQDLYWVLEDEDQQLVLRLPTSIFDEDRAIWATTLMQLWALRGDQARARAFADTAQAEFARQIKETPNDPQRHIFRGMALATLGRKDEAIAEATLGASFNPLSKDHNVGAYYQHQLIRVYLLTGEHEKALDLLEELLQVPYVLTSGYLRIDPNFAPLKGNPRFEKLLRGE